METRKRPLAAGTERIHANRMEVPRKTIPSETALKSYPVPADARAPATSVTGIRAAA
jgi:hypothetical protein